MPTKIIREPEHVDAFYRMVKGKDYVSVPILHKILIVDAIKGELTWRPRTPDFFIDTGKRSTEWQCRSWNGRCAGKTAGKTKSSSGYYIARIFGKNYGAHRVIWAMNFWCWPTGEIDHIDHDRKNNCVSNLRDVTRRTNGMNISLPANNTSGVIGVCFDKARGKWASRIKVRGETINLGRFDSFEDAVAARRFSEEKYGFHKNHGGIVDA